MMVRILILLSLSLLSCSRGTKISGGSDNPDFITVSVFNADSTSVEGARIVFFSPDYDPFSDGDSINIISDTTDVNGVARISVNKPDVYNVVVRTKDYRYNAFLPNVKVSGNDTVLENIYLYGYGEVNFILDDDIDTTDGYIYVEGSDIVRPIRSVIILDSSKYSVIIDSLPLATVTNVSYMSAGTGDKKYLASFIHILPNDTVVVGADLTELKPIWKFSVLAGVTPATVAYFGSLDIMRILITAQLDSLGSKFNKANVFNGKFKFCLDSIYQITFSADSEVASVNKDFDYKIIYDGDSTTFVTTWNRLTRGIHFRHSMSTMFDRSGVDVLSWCAGMGRSALPISWMEVTSFGNPINEQAYVGPESVMEYPYGVDIWDEYNKFVINRMRDSRFDGEHNLIYSSFPESMGIVVRNSSGKVIKGADVSLFGVKWNSQSVDSVPVLNGTSDSLGEFVFDSNPYIPDSLTFSVYGNFLVMVTSGSDTSFGWMPLNEVGLAYYTDPNRRYRKNIVIKR